MTTPLRVVRELPLPYTHKVNHGPQTVVRFYLNRIPIYRSTWEEGIGVTQTTSSNHLLVAGRNRFAAEVVRSEEKFHMSFNLTKNHDYDHPLFLFQWPQVWERIEAPRELPFCCFADFYVDDDFTFEPAYLSAPRMDFPETGTDELRAAVARVHATLEKSDADEFLDEIGLKTDELARAYPGVPLFDPPQLRTTYRERFQCGVTPRKLDFDRLAFERCAGGRVAYVYGTDGQPAITAGVGEDAFATDLWLTHHAGAWRVFR